MNTYVRKLYRYQFNTHILFSILFFLKIFIFK